MLIPLHIVFDCFHMQCKSWITTKKSDPQDIYSLAFTESLLNPTTKNIQKVSSPESDGS